MIHFVKGNILESSAQALVNSVNTEGVMGKGVALQFKKQFPENYRIYKKACENKLLEIGKLLITEEETLLQGKKIIINFPTKTSWRLPSEYEYIEKGLLELKKIILERKIQSIAIPPLGAGNGGLNWHQVKTMIIEVLKELECEIIIYEPSDVIQEVLKKERVKLTPARAMLLLVLYDLVKHGEFVSEFAAEKVAYFLQRFGAESEFKLTFEPKFYGPYSGKVRHVLYYLNGSYIMGYSSKDKKPFDALSLLMDTEADVEKYLNNPEHKKYKDIVEKTKNFLRGYYSDFALELLSTVDYIKLKHPNYNVEDILNELKNWNNRKRSLFANAVHIEKALNHINKHLYY